ncbi:uncharacterized protein F5891DRAFT_974398 [Suillus fuscotomentosus]|uniref:Uncharacterized protein n=1 Tax=Suillus fuscotomentosus TaxID=1912939 RepID=A0AAD4EKE5_9AGAM|nr:uncharacterized protein F5891DRAFT_974398 [Suillus fuscotomentosus]KAG1907745.1 hypothetical protein F5891DRAFT_974398 [Suillus fuscotomentosus]
MSKPAGVGSRTRIHTHTASAEYYPRREYLRVTVWRIGNNTRVNPPTIDGGSSSTKDGGTTKQSQKVTAVAPSASTKKLGRRDHTSSESMTWPEHYQHRVKGQGHALPESSEQDTTAAQSAAGKQVKKNEITHKLRAGHRCSNINISKLKDKITHILRVGHRRGTISISTISVSFGGVLALNVRIYYPPFVRIYPPYQDILSLLSTKYDTYILMLWVIL